MSEVETGINAGPRARGGARSGDFRYEAFISYRHTRRDRKWAKWLAHKLESYVIPPNLREKAGSRERLGRVFRDEDELEASADLKPEIERALIDSRYLIVVCSPQTPGSKWVNEEVRQFRELGRHDRILALLVKGEPSDAFPAQLREIRRTLVDQHGMKRDQIELVEPLAADVRRRWFLPGGHAGRMAKLRLLSCLLGVRFDDLRQREQERRARQMRVVRAVTAALVLLMFGLTMFALVERSDALAQKKSADEQRGIAQENAYKATQQAALAEQQRRAALDSEAQAIAQAKLARDRLSEIRWMAHSKFVEFNSELEHIAGTTNVRLNLALTAQTVLNSLAKTADTPELKKELVEAYLRLGDVLANLITRDKTNLPSVGLCYEQGLQLAAKLADEDPADRDARRLLAGAYRRMANAQRLSEIQRSRLGYGSDANAAAPGDRPRTQPYAQSAANSPFDFLDIDVTPTAVLGEARKRADRARDLAESLVRSAPDREHKGEEWAKAQTEYAEVLTTLGDVEEAFAANWNEQDSASLIRRDAHLQKAEQFHSQAIEHLTTVIAMKEAARDLRASQPLALRLAGVYDTLGDLRLRRVETDVAGEVRTQAYKDALFANFAEAVSRLKRLKGVRNGDVQYQRQLGRAHYRLGAAQAWFNQLDEAQSSYETGHQLIGTLADADVLDLNAWQTYRDVSLDFGLCSRTCTARCMRKCKSQCGCAERALDLIAKAKRAQEVLSKDPNTLVGYNNVYNGMVAAQIRARIQFNAYGLNATPE